MNCFSVSQVKINISSKSVGPVVLLKLMSSSIDESDEPKSNKKSEDYAFLDTLPYGTGGVWKNGIIPALCWGIFRKNRVFAK